MCSKRASVLREDLCVCGTVCMCVVAALSYAIKIKYTYFICQEFEEIAIC